MKLSEKVKMAAKKSKVKLIGATVLFIIILVWAVAPFSMSVYQGYNGVSAEERRYIDGELEDSKVRSLMTNEIDAEDDEDSENEETTILPDEDDENEDEVIETSEELPEEGQAEVIDIEENNEEETTNGDNSSDNDSLTDIMKQIQGQTTSYEAGNTEATATKKEFQWNVFFTQLGFYIIHPFQRIPMECILYTTWFLYNTSISCTKSGFWESCSSFILDVFEIFLFNILSIYASWILKSFSKERI